MRHPRLSALLLSGLIILCITGFFTSHTPARVPGSSLGWLAFPEPDRDLYHHTGITVNGKNHLLIHSRLNAFTSSNQHRPAIGADETGHLWAAWQSRRQENGSCGLYGRSLDSAARWLTPETHINRYVRGSQENPAVLPDPGGQGGWICWESAGQDGDLGGIFASRFSAEWTPLTEELQVNHYTPGHQSELAACSDAQGGFIAIWIGPSLDPAEGADIGKRFLFMRRFDADGHSRGIETRVDTGEAAGIRTPTLCRDGQGGFALAWNAVDKDGRPAGIFLARFGPEGHKAWGPVRVSSPENTWQDIEPVLAAHKDGSLVVVWMSHGADGDDYGVLARCYSPEGRAGGPQFVANDHGTGLQNGATVIGRPDGGFAVLWNTFDPEGQEADVRARLYGPEGMPEGSSFSITGLSEGDRKLQAASGRQQAVYIENDALAVCWSGDGGPGDRTGAYLSVLVPVPEGALPGDPDTGGMAGMAYIKDLYSNPGTGQTGSRQEADIVSAVDTAKPHEPPLRDKRSILKLPFGGDPNPFPLADGGFVGITNTGWAPPDPHMAAGPIRLVAIVNGGIAFFEKSGTLFFQDEIEDSYGFWGSVGATNFVFGPEVIFDPHANRFMAMACERGSSGGSYFLLAVSDDSDPAGTWYKYRINATSLCGDSIDSPNLAVDNEAVYLTADCWPTGGERYAIYILDKTPLLTGGAAVISSTMTINGTQSHGIPVSYGSPPAMYMIEHFESTSNSTVRLHAITDPLGTPSRVTYSLSVPSYGRPEDPPQMGSSVRPETFDARFWSCVWRNGSLWACHHVGSSRVLARWYEIATNGWPSGGTPSLVQSGDIDPGAGIRTFFNSISVDAYGNAATCFARSASDEYISMSRAVRASTDPLGTMQDSVIEKASSGPYTTYSRWGDYSAVSVDPSDGITFWAHHEYTPGGGSWNTWISYFTAPVSNHNPVLTAGTVSPGAGYYGTRFEYTVHYNDADGDAPSLIQVNIDGVNYAMTLDSGTADNGTYQYRTRDIDVGVSHTYYFYAEDGQGGSGRNPDAGTLSGPTTFDPELFLTGTPGAGAWMTVEVWGAADALWSAAWSSQNGPHYVPVTGLFWDLGPGDLHMAKKIIADPVHLDAYGYGSYDFKLPNNISSGTKYIQGGTKMNAFWGQTNQETFEIP